MKCFSCQPGSVSKARTAVERLTAETFAKYRKQGGPVVKTRPVLHRRSASVETFCEGHMQMLTKRLLGSGALAVALAGFSTAAHGSLVVNLVPTGGSSGVAVNGQNVTISNVGS